MTADSASLGKNCDLCDGRDFQLLAERDRRGKPLGTVVCKACGLVVHQQVPSEAALAEFYGSEYREQYHGESSPSERRTLRAWKNGERIRRQLQPYLSPGDQVLEIGAGIGCTVKQFELAGCTSRGIEPHAGFQTFGAEQLRAQVVRCSLFDLPAQPVYDLLLLVHVIEHFRSPRAALTHMASLVKPGGRLYIECPNLAAPFATRSRLFHFAHIHNFTPQTLEMLASRCGFRVEQRFQSERDPNLEMLLVRDEPRVIEHTGSYRATLEAIERHSWAGYHLRWRYLWPRIRQVACYAKERIGAKSQVQSILRRCQAAPATQRRRAA